MRPSSLLDAGVFRNDTDRLAFDANMAIAGFLAENRETEAVRGKVTSRAQARALADLANAQIDEMDTGAFSG